MVLMRSHRLAGDGSFTGPDAPFPYALPPIVCRKNLQQGVLFGSDSFLCLRDNSLEREGRKARPTPTDLRSVPAEVHAFESHPSHFQRLTRAKRGEERTVVLRPPEPLQKLVWNILAFFDFFYRQPLWESYRQCFYSFTRKNRIPDHNLPVVTPGP